MGNKKYKGVMGHENMGKDIVKRGYNEIASDYASQREQFKSLPYLKKLSGFLSKKSTVLDIGCGAGLPVDKFLIEKGHKVIGIDISEKMIELAKKNVPKAEYRVRDMMSLKAGEYKVDAVVSFYAIVHIPREYHKELFKKINSFLSKDGPLLVAMGSEEWEGQEEDFYGTSMWWSHYGSGKNREIVEDVGFKILVDEIDTSESEKHQIILAQKI